MKKKKNKKSRLGRGKKSVNQRVHAKRRASERYGLIINKEMLKECIAMIQNNKAKFLCKTSRTRSLFELTIQGKCVKVVYDKIRKNIATFLPEKIREVPDDKGQNISQEGS